MATGLATATCTSILDAIGNATPFSFFLRIYDGSRPATGGTAT
jgi:hypothetical protein